MLAFWCCCDFEVSFQCVLCVLQPEYHGFGVTVTPNRLSPVNGKAIQEAITQVMTDSAFQV